MTLGCSFKSALNHVFLSPSQTRWNGHFQPNASSLIYCPMKWRHPALKGWLAFQKRQAFLSPRGMKQSLKLQLELADGTGGKPSLPRRRGSFLDVVIFPAVNKANKFWSGACVPEKGADCTVPTVWSLLATARQIKQGKGKGWGGGGNGKFYAIKLGLLYTEKQGHGESTQYFPELSVLTGKISPDDIFDSNPWKSTWTCLQVLQTSVLQITSQAAKLHFVLESSSFVIKSFHTPTLCGHSSFWNQIALVGSYCNFVLHKIQLKNWK